MSQSFSCMSCFRRFLPFLFALGLVLLNAVPAYPISGYFQAIPCALIVIFYFAIFHPSVLNDCMVFVLAILADMLVQGPLGLVIISYVLMFFLAHFLRSYFFNLNFFQLWGVFTFFISLVLSCQYILFCLMLGKWMSFVPQIVGIVVLILIYPFMVKICAAVDACVRDRI